MTDEPQNTANTADKPVNPYKDIEFDVFLKEIGNANLPNWTVLAEAIGVDRDTIARWRQHPNAKAAISSAIEENMRKMTEAGVGDWKMYREKLKMLGVKDKTTIEHEVGETVADTLDRLETDYGLVGKKAKEAQDQNDRPEA